MSIRSWTFALAIGALVLGCEKSDSSGGTNATDAENAAQKVAGDAMNKASETAGKAADVAKDAAAKVSEEAETKITEVSNYIKDNKLDLAEKALNELDKIKDTLPETVKTKLTDARKMLETAKSSAAKKMTG